MSMEYDDDEEETPEPPEPEYLDIDVADIEPPNEVEDEYLLEEIQESMAKSGWSGRPLIAWGTIAYTGSHRIAAARAVGLDVVPTIQLPAGLAGRNDDEKLEELEDLEEAGEIDEIFLEIFKEEG